MHTGTELARDPVDHELLALLHEHGGDLRSAWPTRRTVTALVVFVVADFATFITSSRLRSTDISPSVRLLIVSLILYGALVAAAVHFYRQDGRLRFRDAYGLSFRWSDIAWGFVVSIIARIAATLVVLPIYLIDRDWVGTNVPDGNRLHGAWVLIAIAMAAVVFAPIVEELYFRGFVQRALQSTWTTWAAIGVASALFGLGHIGFQPGLGSIGIALSTGTAGAVFGITAWYTKRLGTGMAAHAWFNALAVFALIVRR